MSHGKQRSRCRTERDFSFRDGYICLPTLPGLPITTRSFSLFPVPGPWEEAWANHEVVVLSSIVDIRRLISMINDCRHFSFYAPGKNFFIRYKSAGETIASQNTLVDQG